MIISLTHAAFVLFLSGADLVVTWPGDEDVEEAEFLGKPILLEKTGIVSLDGVLKAVS